MLKFFTLSALFFGFTFSVKAQAHPPEVYFMQRIVKGSDNHIYGKLYTRMITFKNFEVGSFFNLETIKTNFLADLKSKGFNLRRVSLITPEMLSFQEKETHHDAENPVSGSLYDRLATQINTTDYELRIGFFYNNPLPVGVQHYFRVIPISELKLNWVDLSVSGSPRPIQDKPLVLSANTIAAHLEKNDLGLSLENLNSLKKSLERYATQFGFKAKELHTQLYAEITSPEKNIQTELLLGSHTIQKDLRTQEHTTVLLDDNQAKYRFQSNLTLNRLFFIAGLKTMIKGILNTQCKFLLHWNDRSKGEAIEG